MLCGPCHKRLVAGSGIELSALCLVCHSYRSGNNSHYFCELSFSRAFIYMHWTVAETAGWPCSVAPFKMCLALGPHLPPSEFQAQLSSFFCVLLALPLAGICSFRAWHWLQLQCLPQTALLQGHKREGTDGVFPAHPCLPRCNEGRSPIDGT